VRAFFFADGGPLQAIASFPRFAGSVPDEALPLAFVRPTFDEVYAETFPAVWRMASRLGIVDSALDDVLQDVYLTVFRKLEHFEGRSAVKTWVLAITIRVVSNHIRMRRRKGAAHALTSVVDDPESVPDAAPDPLERLAREEAMRTVRELIAGMDQRCAAVFMLVELGGLSVAEIARELGGNVNTLQGRLCAARRDFERGLQRRQARSR
jgi:RNA polymerase sigma-70 factor (ECF subfamily)